MAKYICNQRRLFVKETIQPNERHTGRKWLAGLGVGILTLLPACGGKTETVHYDLQATCANDKELQITDIDVNGVAGGFTLSCEGEAPTSVSVIDGPEDEVYPTAANSEDSHIVEVAFEDYSDNFSGGEATIGKITIREDGARVVIQDMEDFERIQVVG